MSDLSGSARQQAELGHRVHPLQPGGKTPKLKGWQANATAELGQLTEWWGRWPDGNIGVVIGHNETVVDIDTERAHDEFRERVGEPETTVIRTPRGGWHYLFAGSLPNRVLIKDGSDRLLEVKGARTNRVAPGSVCPDGRWTLSVDAPQAPLPDALVEWASSTRTDKGRQRKPLEDAAGRPLFEGDRNTMLTRVAGQLRRVGGTLKTIEPFLITYNRQYCRPPLPDDEVRRVARSVSSYPRAPEWTYDPPAYAAKVASAYGLAPAAEWLLAYLYRHANDKGEVRRGTRRMAEELRISHPTVTAARRQLLATKVVELVGEDKRYGSTFKVEPNLPLDSLSKLV